jgi:TRAP-type mannitol/chloroaromatic compound transport system substrate-binding protein
MTSTARISGDTKTERATSRRKFLKGGVAMTTGLAGAATLGLPAISRAQTVTLKMQGAWGTKDIFNDYAEDYVKRVNDMGGGRLRIDYLVAGSVVNPWQVQDAVHKGVLDAGHQVTAHWYGKNKAAALFGTGPVFGQNPHHTLAWIHYGGGQGLYEELVQKILGLNLVGFFCMPMPAQPLGWFKKRIKSVRQLNGLKYRTVGLAAEIMEAMGLKVTQLPSQEIFPALERGVIEAFEYNNPTSDRRFGAQDVSKTYMMGSFHQPMDFFEIIFNKTKYESLAKEQQAILKHAAEAATTANFGLAMDTYSRDLQRLIDSYGVEVYRTPESVMEGQLDAWDKVLRALMKDPFVVKVLKSQKEWAQRVAFYELLNSPDYTLAYEHYFGKL